MTNSTALYQPSILELAKAGNFQAISYWINTFFAPHGIHVRVSAIAGRGLRIYVHFQTVQPEEIYLNLRRRIVRSICYRLWVLNSSAIDRIQIVAQANGRSKILWQQSVRIITPANAARTKSYHRSRLFSVDRRRQFQILRSWLLSHASIATLVLIGWLVYFEAMTQPQLESQAQLVALHHNRTRAIAPALEQFAEEALDEAFPVVSSGYEIPRHYQGRIVRSVVTTGIEKVIALTFDDGPWSHTEQVLDILQQYGVKATFFMVGRHLEMYPDVARRVVAEGHAVGNGTMNHPTGEVDRDTAIAEVDRNAQLIEDKLGVKTSLFRPPMGDTSGEITEYARQQQYAVTLWSTEGQDYFVAAPLIVDNILSNVKPGGIVLLHDGGGDRTATVEALPQIIETLKRQGYRFVTIPELLNLRSVPIQVVLG